MSNPGDLGWLDKILKSLDEPDPERDAEWEKINNAKHGEVNTFGVFKIKTLDARIACIETFAHLEKKYGLSSAEVHKAFAEQGAWVAEGNHTIKPGSILEQIEREDRTDWNFHLEMYLGHIGTLEEIPEKIKNSGL